MKLLTAGDSFTYGEELANLNLAWPHLLGEKLGYIVDNQGKPSSSNTTIIRQALTNYQNSDLIVVAWSHYARIEIADQNGVYEIWPGSNESVYNLFPYRKEIVRYITNYFDDRYFYQQYLINVLLVQNFLKQQNKKYIMVNAFGNNWEEFKSVDIIKELADQIDVNYFLGWPNDQMVEWTYGCAKGPYGHFLEQGHQRVADKIYEHIRNLGWVS
jgi:lysophospholipase L1-like esterase